MYSQYLQFAPEFMKILQQWRKRKESVESSLTWIIGLKVDYLRIEDIETIDKIFEEVKSCKISMNRASQNESVDENWFRLLNKSISNIKLILGKLREKKNIRDKNEQLLRKNEEKNKEVRISNPDLSSQNIQFKLIYEMIARSFCANIKKQEQEQKKSKIANLTFNLTDRICKKYCFGQSTLNKSKENSLNLFEDLKKLDSKMKEKASYMAKMQMLQNTKYDLDQIISSNPLVFSQAETRRMRIQRNFGR